jgi:hypothetical protein
MGRKDLLTKLSDEIRIENSYQHHWLVNYAFASFKPSPNFFVKITELTDKIKQRGRYAEKRRNVFLTDDLHGAIIAAKLARHYGAVYHMFKSEEIDSELSSIFDLELVIESYEIMPVMKAICYQLKKHLRSLSSQEVDILGRFLIFYKHASKHQFIAVPGGPFTKEELERLLQYCTSLQVPDFLITGSYGMQLDEAIPILRAVENYIEDNKGIYSDDFIHLENVLERVESEYDNWITQQTGTVSDGPLGKRISRILSLQASKALIAREIS